MDKVESFPDHHVYIETDWEIRSGNIEGECPRLVVNLVLQCALVKTGLELNCTEVLGHSLRVLLCI